MKPAIIWATFVMVLVTQYVEGFSVLHKILKLNENASVEELKMAYEKLLQQWYKASRSLTTEAELLHLKVVQAYKELKSEIEIDFHEKHLMVPEYFKSTAQTLGIEVLHSISVPLTFYNEKLLRDSHKRLHLVLFYSVNSIRTRIIHNWFNLVEMLTPLGVVMVTINMDNEDVDVAKNVIGEYPPTFPYLVLLIDGIPVPYRSNDEFIDFMIMDFIRRNLPEDLLQILTDASAKKYLSSWHNDSKVRALIFQPSLPPRLQYLLIAFLHRNYISFGFMNLEDEKVRNTSRRMNVSDELDTLFIFKEDQQFPSVKIFMSIIPAKLLNDTLSKHYLLTLPRITSQEMFDTICPIRTDVSVQKSLCVVLVIKNSLNIRIFDPKTTFRRFVQEYSHYFADVAFMYVYNDYQPGFALPIKTNSQGSDDSPYVIALTRTNRNRIKYKFLIHDDNDWQNYESIKERLKMSIEEVLNGHHLLLADTVHINEFVSETPPSLINRILYRLQTYMSKLTLENLLPYIIFLGTAIYFIAYFTSYWNKVQCVWNMLVETEDQALLGSSEKVSLKPRKKKELSPEVFMKNDKCITSSRELRLHELKAETYNGMVRLLKPGCRTIILMFDRERADLLVSQFYKAIWPYRKNKNLLFGYLNTEKKATLEWYSELVKACLPEQQDIEINPYFCAGTVLALSGMRKYFCLYHLKHPGIVPSKDKPELSIQCSKRTYSDDELLIGLRDWLDRLFDGSGSVIRYRVNHWPEFKIL